MLLNKIFNNVPPYFLIVQNRLISTYLICNFFKTDASPVNNKKKYLRKKNRQAIEKKSDVFWICLATSEPGIAHGSTDDKISAGIDVEHCLLNKKIQVTIYKKKELTRYKNVADKDIKLVSVKQGFNQVSGSGSAFGIRIREGKNDPQKQKKLRNQERKCLDMFSSFTANNISDQLDASRKWTRICMYNLLMINYGGIRERSLPLLNIHTKVVLTNIRLLSTQNINY